MEKIEYVILNNELKMQKIGYGTYQLNQSTCAKNFKEAIESVYRLIDTTQLYKN